MHLRHSIEQRPDLDMELLMKMAEKLKEQDPHHNSVEFFLLRW